MIDGNLRKSDLVSQFVISETAMSDILTILERQNPGLSSRF